MRGGTQLGMSQKEHLIAISSKFVFFINVKVDQERFQNIGIMSVLSIANVERGLEAVMEMKIVKVLLFVV